MGLYTKTRKIWCKKLSSEKTWAGFKKFFLEEHHDLYELKCVNANQVGFHGVNISIKIQYDINKELENLSMATTSGKYLLTQIISTIKQLAETDKNLTDQIKTLTATNARLTSNG